MKENVNSRSNIINLSDEIIFKTVKLVSFQINYTIRII